MRRVTAAMLTAAALTAVTGFSAAANGGAVAAGDNTGCYTCHSAW